MCRCRHHHHHGIAVAGYFRVRQVPSVPQAVVLFHSLVTSVSGKFHLSHKPWFCFTASYWLLPCQASPICPTSCGSVSLPGYFRVRQVPSVPQAVVLFYSLLLVTFVSGKSYLSHKLWFCFTLSYWLLLCHENPICPTSRGSVSLPGYFCVRQVPSVPQAVVLFPSLLLVTSETGKFHLSHMPWFCFTPWLLL